MEDRDKRQIRAFSRAKSDLLKIKKQGVLAREMVMACDLAEEHARQEVSDTKNALLNDHGGESEYRPYEIVPDSEIEDIYGWTINYRRRVWGTAFSGGFPGKPGTRDMMLLLSLGHIMAQAGTRVFRPSLTDIVRVSALDKHTVVKGLESTRKSGYLLRVDAQAYALDDCFLTSLAESPNLPEKTLANRFFLGDREADAFGGMRGVKITEIRAWMWMLLMSSSGVKSPKRRSKIPHL